MRLLGMETEAESFERGQSPSDSDRSDPLREAGLLLGERMIKQVEYHVLLNSKPAEAFKILETLREQADKVSAAVLACNENVGHGPVPVLTRTQREYIEANKEAVRGDGERLELSEGLERVVTIDPDRSAEHNLINEPELVEGRNAAKEIAPLLIPT